MGNFLVQMSVFLVFLDLPEEARSSWKELVEGALNDVNVKNTTQMVSYFADYPSHVYSFCFFFNVELIQGFCNEVFYERQYVATFHLWSICRNIYLQIRL